MKNQTQKTAVASPKARRSPQRRTPAKLPVIPSRRVRPRSAERSTDPNNESLTLCVQFKGFSKHCLLAECSRDRETPASIIVATLASRVGCDMGFSDDAEDATALLAGISARLGSEAGK